MNFNYNEGLTPEQIALKERLARQILRDYSKLSEPKSQISSIPICSSVEDFVDSLADLIDLNQDTAGQRVLLRDSHHSDNLFEDPDDPTKELSGVVLYSMKRRAPGTMSGGNVWFNRERREVKPRLRDIITNDINNPGQVKLIYSQWFDNELRFDIAARTNKRANELALWFEDLMESNREFFAYKGITKYFMNIRESDESRQYGNDQVECRPYYYFVRTEGTYEVTEQALNRLIISLNAKR